jgi:hypothetical protein
VLVVTVLAILVLGVAPDLVVRATRQYGRPQMNAGPASAAAADAPITVGAGSSSLVR